MTEPEAPDPYFAPPPGTQPPGTEPSATPSRAQPPPSLEWGNRDLPTDAYASWLQRVGAYLLDSIIVIPAWIVAGIGGAVGGAVGVLLVIVGYVGGIVFTVWNQVFRQGNTGRSLGKEWLGLTLVGDGSMRPIGPGMAFVRTLAHVLDALCYIGFLWPLWDRKRQTFADKVCSTVVVRG